MTEQPPDPSTYEGDEGAPPANVPPPVRYQPDSSVPVPAPSPAQGPLAPPSGPTTGDRLAAASGPLALVLFFVCGFLGGWAWSWIFFLLPGVLYAWNRGGHARD
ncbi:MAG: hypothetical protein ABI131_00065 [Nostocoides sp.]